MKFLIRYKIFLFISLLFYEACSPKIIKEGISNVGSLYTESPIETVQVVADKDNDGIPDSLDKCIEIGETFNFFADDDGCPDLAPYPDSLKLETKDIEIFVNNGTELNKDIMGSIQLQFLYNFFDYPNTFYIIKITSPYNAESKAATVKSFIDKQTNQPERTKIDYDISENDNVFLLLNKSLAKENIVIQHKY
jgi:hypothetical protein